MSNIIYFFKCIICNKAQMRKGKCEKCNHDTKKVKGKAIQGPDGLELWEDYR